jgi:hypothetical protein
MNNEIKAHRLISTISLEKDISLRRNLIFEFNKTNSQLHEYTRKRNIISMIKSLNSDDKLTYGITKMLYKEISEDTRKRYALENSKGLK